MGGPAQVRALPARGTVAGRGPERRHSHSGLCRVERADPQIDASRRVVLSATTGKEEEAL